MKHTVTTLLALLCVSTTTTSHAFVQTTVHVASSSSLAMAVELIAEPEGGTELTAISSTMPGCRVKQMDELQGVKCDFGTPYEFWMTAEVDGALIKEVRTQILKDASKKANFPGFRKVRKAQKQQKEVLLYSNV